METVLTEPLPEPVVEPPPHVCTCDKLHIEVEQCDRDCIEQLHNGVALNVIVRNYCADMVQAARRQRLMLAMQKAMRTGSKLPAEDHLETFLKDE